nr:MAG TPA: hypothetical protein [Caudoviricetes sp.]
MTNVTISLAIRVQLLIFSIISWENYLLTC